MGTPCSKICVKKPKKSKYKKPEGKDKDEKTDIKRNDKKPASKPEGDESGGRKPNGQPSQPVNNESVRNYAINDGGKTELDKGDDENMKQNNYVPPNIGNNVDKDEKERQKENERKKEKERKDENEKEEKKERKEDGKRKRKKRRTRRKRKTKDKFWSDSDSSWSSSSSSSSDDDTGKTTRSRQKKKDKDGNVTYITNKTTIGSSKISFKAAKNINIYNKEIVKQSPAAVERKLFTKEYTPETAKLEEKNLFSLFGNDKPAFGQFVDLRGNQNVMSAFEIGVLNDCLRWVGQIVFPEGSCTCFRVGKNYIMTALHAIRKALAYSLEFIPVQGATSQTADDILQHLHDRSIYVDFTYLIKTKQSRPERNRFYFKHVERVEDVPFCDEETDTIVLELEEEQDKPLPLQFTNFGIPALDKPFHLITHSKGQPKAVDKVFKMVDKNSPHTVDDINFLERESRRFLQEKNVNPDNHPCQTRPYNLLSNQTRHLFHCASSKGASGSPGVQVTSSGRVVVVTMLIHGYPDWYYNEMLAPLRVTWPEQNTIEQGVDFASVYTKMRDRYPMLCNDIFPTANQPTDSTAHSVHAVQPTD